MYTLKKILYNVPLKAISGSSEVSINELIFDSRKVKKNNAFIAINGTKLDGHNYIPNAIELGATLIVCEKMPDILSEEITYVEVKNSAKALGIMAANYFNNPSKKLNLIGVTGTNGKTTVATLLYHLFNQLGYKTGLLSTIENKIGDKTLKTTHTTENAIQINNNLNEMLKEGCTHCFMEVSSHALKQKRVGGIHYTGALFTNISHDHLDYHKTFDAYIAAKKELFDDLPKTAFSLINADDRRGKIMLQNTNAKKNTFSLKTMSNFKGKIISNSLSGLEMKVEEHNIWFKLLGEFNAYNLLLVYGTAILLGERAEDILAILSNINPIPGRMEVIPNSVKITVFVDYAHTPDALKNVLNTIEKIRTGNERVITVVGCGGGKDKEKRPLMGAIASEMSDKTIFTSDNPRNEDPGKIIKEMKNGVQEENKGKIATLVSREEAIKTACLLASPGDIILVAGKGHEEYIEIKGERKKFADKKVLIEMLTLMKN